MSQQFTQVTSNALITFYHVPIFLLNLLLRTISHGLDQLIRSEMLSMSLELNNDLHRGVPSQEKGRIERKFDTMPS